MAVVISIGPLFSVGWTKFITERVRETRPAGRATGRVRVAGRRPHAARQGEPGEEFYIERVADVPSYIAQLFECAMIADPRGVNPRDHRTALPPDPVGRYRGQARLVVCRSNSEVVRGLPAAR